MNKTIKIARAVRNYPGGIAEATLVWRVFYSKFGVNYHQIDTLGKLQATTSDRNVKTWLPIFVCDQSCLNSWQLVAPPTDAWQEVIKRIVRMI